MMRPHAATLAVALCLGFSAGCLIDRHHPYDQERCAPGCPSGTTCYEGTCQNGAGQQFTLAGAIQKGPFALGTSVQVSVLDNKGGQTGTTFTADTKNDLGEYEVSVGGGSLCEVTATGSYFHELDGMATTADLKLQALVKVTPPGKHQANVNVMTHMARKRALKLIGDGTDPLTAIRQAEQELRTAIGMHHPGANPGLAFQTDYLREDVGDTQYLFAVGCVMMQAGTITSVQERLDVAGLILEPDGKLNPGLVGTLEDAEKALEPEKCRSNLQQWLASRKPGTTVPDPETVIDTDKDGKPNSEDLDDDGDGVPDEGDCARLDPLKQVLLVDGTTCVEDDDDDDDDSILDSEDCAPLDPSTFFKAVGVCDTGDATSVVVSNGYPPRVFVADRSAGLCVCDPVKLQAPGTITPVACVSTAGEPTDVRMSGNYALVATGTAGLRVFDVSGQPKEVGSYATVDARAVAVSVGHAFVVGKGPDLVVVDVSSPTNPVKVGQASLTQPGDGYDVDVFGSAAFVAVATQPSTSGSVVQFDLSSGTSPTYNGDLIKLTDPVAVRVVDGIAYIWEMQGMFHVVDVAKKVEFSKSSLSQVNAKGRIAVAADRVYLASGKGIFAVADVSNPSKPKWLAQHKTGGDAKGVFVEGKYAYVADGAAGLRVYQLSCP